jgi:hypothetical protein
MLAGAGEAITSRIPHRADCSGTQTALAARIWTASLLHLFQGPGQAMEVSSGGDLRNAMIALPA